MGLLRLLAFILIPSFALAQSKLMPYRTDACTIPLMPMGLTKDIWMDCCTSHDFSYWVGGTDEDREMADDQLGDCLKSNGASWFSVVAAVFFAKIYGGNRWGSRWIPQRPNQPLSLSEWQQVEKYKDSFKFGFPIVRDASGKKCSTETQIDVLEKTTLKFVEDLICFELVNIAGNKVKEQMIMSENCLGYFIHQKNRVEGQSKALFEGAVDCEIFVPSKERIRKFYCGFSAPPYRDYEKLAALASRKVH